MRAVERERGRDRDGVAIHDVRHRHPADALGEHGLRDGAACRLTQEQAEEDEPHAAQHRAEQHLGDAQADQQVGEALAECRGDAGCAHPVAGDPPRHRARDATAVEREGGHQVEDEQRQVDQRQPAQQQQSGAHVGLAIEHHGGPEAVRSADRDARGHADCDHDQCHGRSGDGDLELGPWRVRISAHLGDASEEPQIDPGDRDPLPASHERVAQLVQHQARRRTAARWPPR